MTVKVLNAVIAEKVASLEPELKKAAVKVAGQKPPLELLDHLRALLKDAYLRPSTPFNYSSIIAVVNERLACELSLEQSCSLLAVLTNEVLKRLCDLAYPGQWHYVELLLQEQKQYVNPGRLATIALALDEQKEAARVAAATKESSKTPVSRKKAQKLKLKENK